MRYSFLTRSSMPARERLDMSLSGLNDVIMRERAVAPVALLMLLASCHDPTRAGTLTVRMNAEPSVAVGERQTGVNAGNVLCPYVVRAAIEGEAGATAHWLNSREVLHF